MTIIGISGARGSFSEQAAREYVRTNNISDFRLEYLISAENVLTTLNQGKIDLGIFPIENSNGGVVLEAIYAMSKHIFNIKNIFEIPVIHCLLVAPGTKKETIAKIASHPQAIKQCKMYLKRIWPKAGLEERDDTAHAAEDLKNKVLSATTAVIAPESCAKLYNLEILEKGIQDLKFNYTSFLAVKK
ncbi:prephenate dehydratase [Patescibacteria group bacterium]|nr:prephenate dehydratase [Patescibacteria group bacterium]MBU4512692.1 prephenate dehydratase [Patescibacteria group bacterium]MCG2693594.1 prephenate dehydratase [Candidatus Parcubacteria bacterium]